MKEIKRYSKQFKMEAIRLVKGQGYKILEAEWNLEIYPSSFEKDSIMTKVA